MIKNSISHEIIVVNSVNTGANSANITKKGDEYCIGETFDIAIPTLFDKLNDSTIEPATTAYATLIKCAELGILALEGYEDWIENGIVHWTEPDWRYRVYVTNEQIKFITSNYFTWVQALYDGIPNPQHSTIEGMVIYLNNIAEEERALLDSMGINIENRP